MRCLVLLAALSLASCATVFNHPAQPVALTPEFPPAAAGDPKPERVRVLIKSGLGTYRAALPTRFTITPDTWTHVSVTVVEPCFKGTEHSLPRSITLWVFGDVAGFVATAGAAGVLSVVGDGLDGALWSYDREAKVPVEPVADYAACMAENRKRPGLPFPATRDPVWQDPRAESPDTRG